jgi:hypothetical protein
MGFCNHFSELQCIKDFGVVEELNQWSGLTQDLSGKPFFVLLFRKFGGLCTLTGVREKPGGREKAKRGKKEKDEVEGEEEKEKGR